MIQILINHRGIQTPDAKCLSHIQHTHTRAHTQMPTAHTSYSHTHTVTRAHTNCHTPVAETEVVAVQREMHLVVTVQLANIVDRGLGMRLGSIVVAS